MRVLHTSLLAPRPRNPTLGVMVHRMARARTRMGSWSEVLAPTRVFPDARLIRSVLRPRRWREIRGNFVEWTSLWRGARGQRELEGVPYVYRRFSTRPSISRRGNNADGFLRANRRWLANTFGARSYDLVLGHFLDSSPLTLELARATGARSGVFVHEDLDTLAAQIGENRVRMRLSSMDFLFTHGVRVRRQIQTRLENPPPIAILPVPIDDAILTADSSPWAPGEPFRLVCISRFFGLKNQIVLLDTLARWWAEDRSPSLELELAGDRGPTRHELEREIGRRGLGSRVTITTVRNSADVAAALGRAHALVHPSRCESLSQAVLEAMAVGLPALTGPNVGAREEIARRGGRMAPAFDVESAASLEAALTDLTGAYPNHRDDTLDLRALIHREFTDREFATALDAAVQAKAWARLP